jgi:hypothetical protein
MRTILGFSVWFVVTLALPSLSFAQTLPSMTNPTGLETVGFVAFFSSGDLDGNGLDDVVIIDSSKQVLSIFLQATPGVFPLKQSLAIASGETFSCLDVRDANNDGKAEILVERSVSTDPPKLYVFGLFFTELDSYPFPIGSTDGVTNCRFVDLQGNGNGLDIVATKAGVGDGAVILFHGSIWSDDVFNLGDGSDPITNPYGIAGGDFDNDGNREVVISEASSAGNGLHFYDVQSDFTTTPNAAVNPSLTGAGGQLQEYENGSGGTDLFVFGEPDAPGFYLSGTGSPMSKYTSGWDQGRGYIGEWDGEGVKVIAGHINGVSIYSVGPMSDSFLADDGSMGGSYSGIRVLDGNGDGRPDFLVHESNGLYWKTLGPCTTDPQCPQTFSCDTGQCIAPTNVPAAPVTPTDYEPSAFRLGDINGDGHLDVVWSSSVPASADMYIYYGNPDIVGKFEETTPYIGDSGEGRDVEIGDCNNDGRLDIVTVGNSGMNNELRIHKNLGGGMFSVATLISTGALFAVQSVAMGDVDGDGDLDIAVARDNGGVSIFSNDGSCGYGTSARWQSGGTYNDPSLTFYEGPTGVELALAHDGGITIFDQFRGGSWQYKRTSSVENADTDDVVFGQWGVSTSSLMVGTSTSSSRIYTLTFPNPPNYAPLTVSPPASLAATWCDADTDGVADITFLETGGTSLQIFGATATGTTPDLEFAPPAAPAGARFIDVQCGGFGTNAPAELILLIKDSSGFFHFTHFAPKPEALTGFTNIASGLALRDMRAADLNSDGYMDLLGVGVGIQLYWLNNGASFGSSTAISPLYTKTSSAPIGDFDGDGDLDTIFLSEEVAEAPNVFSNNVGAFTPFGTAPSANQRIDGITADLNGDGWLDVAYCLGNAPYGIDVLLADSSDGDLTSATWSNYWGAACSSLAFGDFDADGDYDLATAGTAGGRIFINDGSGVFGTNLAFASGNRRTVAVLDANGDGKQDILIGSDSGLAVFANLGGLAFLQTWTGGASNYKDVAVGDLNDDGKDDFAAASTTPGESRVFLNTSILPVVDFGLGSGFTTGGVLNSVVLVDVDNDGDLDVVGGPDNTGTNLRVWKNNAHWPTQTWGGAFSSFFPNSSTFATVRRPGLPNNLSDGGGGRLVMTGPDGKVTIPFSLYDRDGDRGFIDIRWRKPGTAWQNGTFTLPETVPPQTATTTPLKASFSGVKHHLIWDVGADSAYGQGVEIRIDVFQAPKKIAYPLQTAVLRTVSPPMTIVDSCFGVFCGGGTCVAGTCYTTPCMIATDCLAPAVCYPDVGTCGPLDLCASALCPAGTVCYEGGCFPTCVDDGDCIPPFECFADAGRCVIDACAGVLCPLGATCFGGSCLDACSMVGVCPVGDVCYATSTGPLCFGDPDPCLNVDCSGSDVCYEGGCFPGCATDVDCSADPEDICFDASGICATTDNICDDVVCPFGSMCWMGGCYPICGGDSDCIPPNICYDGGFCASPVDPCDDVVCPSSYACYEGGCYPTCVDDGDCLPPDVCADSGVCINGNDPCENVLCPVGDVCYQGGCYESCLTNGDCSPPFSLCYDATFCISTTDPCANVACPLGQVCHEGGCFEGCSASDPCSPPLECFDDAYCTTEDDACADVICPASQTCYQGGCFSNCVSSTDCGTPEICYGEPVDVMTMSSLDRCAVDACQDIACGEGEVCFQGGCFPTCVDDGDCSPPNLCFTNHCAVDPCDGIDCEIGQTCSGGGCFTACGANMDCPGYVGSSVRFIEVATAVNAATPGRKDGGIAWGDINNDGCLDFGVNTTDGTVKSRLYLSDCNLPNPKFTDVTGALAPNLLSASGKDRSIIFGDVDNDGDLDFALNSTTTIAIYKNGGSGASWAFTSSQTFSNGYDGLAWIDYDGDKDLDLVTENSGSPGPVLVHRNNGSGTFTELALAGLGLPTSSAVGDYSAAVDLDLDGDVDFLVRKDGTTVADVYLNDGDGTWTPSPSIFNQNADNSNKGGIAVCDFDNDGDFDIFWTDNGTNQIWRQTTPLTFVPSGEPAASSGVAIPSDIDDVVCGDLDHDGWVDIVLSARNRDYVFMNRTTTAGLAFVQNNMGITGDEDGEGIALGDYDNDGALDLLINQDNQNELWRNPRSDDRYLMIAPQVALGGTTTRAAIGATIIIQDADGNILGLREVNGGRGHGSQDPPEVHYGLRYGSRVPYALTVTFPHGPRVTQCVVPNSIPGYQRVVIKDTDSDDLTACTVASGTWTSLIELPSSLASGEFCFGDHCATESCEGIECPVGTTCYGGNCNNTCTSSAMCAAGETCSGGICVDGTDPACDGGDFICPNEYECFVGDCFPTCNAEADCGAGELCYQGKCIVDDCTTVTCPSGSTCHHGICFGGCTVDSDCPSGEGCYDGRCAANGCSALDDAYDTNFLYRSLDRSVFATQSNVTPFITPRVVQGAAGVDFATWVNMSGGKSLNTQVPATKTARVAIYLDRTKANGDNPDGRYVLWLQHGSTAAGQAASSATYRVHVKNPSGTPTVLLNDDNESVDRIDTYQYVFQTTSTSGPSDTGGVAIGYLDSKRDRDWVVRIDAAFDGDLTRWEFYNPEGIHTALDASATLTIKQVDFDDSQVWAREVGQACAGSGARGICGIGTGYCEIGELRCQQTVYPWAFEVCDGRDNTCDGRIDEVDTMQYPEVSYRTSSSNPWTTWVTHDENKSAASFMNFTPRGADDRVGSPAMVSTDGSGPMGAWDKSVITSHRNRRTGTVSLNIQMAADYTNAAMESFGDYDAETRVRFTGSSNSVDELFVAWHDDRKPGATSDEVPQYEEPDRFDLEWEVERTGSGVTARREGDGAVLQSMWSGAYSDLNELQARYYWTRDDNDDDSKPRLKWRLNSPYQPETALDRERDLYVRIAGVPPSDSTCAAASPTATGCELSRYSCRAGVTTCGAADDAVCKRCRDFDRDGFIGYDAVTCDTGLDCNDTDPNIHPGADERCNGLDDDCDGEVDFKDDAAYAILWSTPVPVGSQSCPPGDATCGPKECRYAFACVCPDGPEDPADPPAVPCRCGEGFEADIEPTNMSVMPSSEPAQADGEISAETDGGCSATGAAMDASWLLLLGLGLLRRRTHF